MNFEFSQGNLTSNRCVVFQSIAKETQVSRNISYAFKPKEDTWARNVGKFDGNKRSQLVYVVSTPRIDIGPCSVVADDLSTREHKISN